jgi:uncharacterized protein (TIGR03067 family)
VALSPALLLLFFSRESAAVQVSGALLGAAVAAGQAGPAGAAAAAGLVSERALAWAALAMKSAAPVRYVVAAVTILLAVLCAWQLSPAWEGSLPAGSGAGGAASASATGDRTALQGSWLLISAERNGRRAPAEALTHANLVINSINVIFVTGSGPEGWLWELDSNSEPRGIDLTQARGGLVRRGIYKLEDEALTLCLAPPGEKRPADLTAGPETGCTLLVYRRDAGCGGK